VRTTFFRRIGALAAVIPLTLLLVGCAHSNDHVTMSSVSINGATGYSPTTIVASKKDNLIVTVANTTDKTHGFSIQGYKRIVKTVAPGKTLTIKISLTQAGTFKVYCQLHPAHGTATLIVQ
jgi:plastocyanin